MSSSGGADEVTEGDLKGDKRTRNGARGRSGPARAGFKRRRPAGGGDRGGKRWKSGTRSREFTFLLGGNKRDPLNLGALKPDSRPSSPVLPSPTRDEIEIVIPRDFRDPLNLNKLQKQHRKRMANEAKCQQGRDETGKKTETGRTVPPVKGRGADKIVSPVPPVNPQRKHHRPISRKPPTDSRSTSSTHDHAGHSDSSLTDETKTEHVVVPEKTKEDDEKALQKRAQKQKFRYGNYNRYYGLRLPGVQERDPRLELFDATWFRDAHVLDIGCNVGFVTLQIAKHLAPRRVLGVDIDPHLVGVARKNIRHYCDSTVSLTGKFPASFASRFGPLSAPSTSFSNKFPDNVWFRTENYVLDADFVLDAVKEEFNVILALSVTKWIHLNWGDAGLKRFFHRVFRQLHPGGRFILEAQDFASYRKRAKITPEMEANYKTIELKPAQFHRFLIDEVGFDSHCQIGVPRTHVKGFRRPIDVYVKKGLGEAKEKESGNARADRDDVKKSEEKGDDHPVITDSGS